MNKQNSFFMVVNLYTAVYKSFCPVEYLQMQLLKKEIGHLVGLISKFWDDDVPEWVETFLLLFAASLFTLIIWYVF